MQLNDKLKFVLEAKVFNIPSHILVENDAPQGEFDGADKEAVEKVGLSTCAVERESECESEREREGECARACLLEK